ncbi:MAG TPA: hypothetical protein VLB44_01250 [Kofleriaceae bacterium]|nr:hypothetical protein [Kofleriaceae bacterium]
MIKPSLVLIALAIAGHAAYAQPGETPPVSGQGDAQVQQETLLDQAIAQARANAPTIERVAMGTLRRARRSISIGPTVGLWSAAFIDPGDIDAALTFGIGVEMFKVPVLPDVETLQDLITERVKAQAKQRIVQVFQGRQPDPIEINQIVLQVYEDVRKEILGLENVRAKTMERPAFSFALEANRLFAADRWQGRLRAGIGIWKFTLAGSFAVGRACRGTGCDDGVKMFAGPEVVLHFLTSKNPRASVLDAFLRADFQVNSRGTETYDQLVLGGRYLFDLI